MHKDVNRHVRCVVYVKAISRFYFTFHKTIKASVRLEIVSDVNVELYPLKPSNEACSISLTPNLTS